jgi:DNA processing protein
LALLRAPGIGPARFARLLNTFGSPAAVFDAQRRDWEALGLVGATLDYLAAPDWDIVERDLLWLADANNHMLCLGEPSYPPLLRQIPAPPPILFVRGNSDCLSTHQIAIVGTRNPTVAGRETALQFAAHLANAGLGITSGLALGIDGEAHRGALRQRGCTIGVMGTGPDRIYPARHRELAHGICENGGALVSELPPGATALPEHFPRRNRIISGLSLGVLIIEASLRSGSLITARLATEQGREVFAIPGSIHNPMAKGCHRLIRQGAKLVENATDILEELAPLAAAAVDPALEKVETILSEPELDEDYQQLLKNLGQEPVSIDLLVERCGLTPEAVSSMLLILELQGVVVSVPGGLYYRCR